MGILDLAIKGKKATSLLQTLGEEQRLMALESLATALLRYKSEILSENEKDLIEARKNQLSPVFIDRLTLTEKTIEALSKMCKDVALQEQVVGTIVEEYKRPNGLIIQKQRIPIGVIGMVFESRPNVVIDGAVLAIKSGNALILKGGKEASYSNKILFEVISRALHGILPEGTISLIETREDVAELLKLHEYIDLMVPRGGSALINYVRKNATMPVVAHDKGLCHIYVHKDADVSMVVPIILNAKTQRPSACNALESLLLHEKYPGLFEVIDSLIKAQVAVRGCEKSCHIHPHVKLASEEDYDQEYLDQIISLKIVKNEHEALDHIKKHTSHHTEGIIARSEEVISEFLQALDASVIVVNASTRFNDGGELGLGAELGISTSKLHAYGPMGAKEMTTTRFLVIGNGQVR